MTQEQSEKFWKAVGAVKATDCGCYFYKDKHVFWCDGVGWKDPSSLDLETLLEMLRRVADKKYQLPRHIVLESYYDRDSQERFCVNDFGKDYPTGSAAVLSAICTLVGVEMD